MRNFWTALLIVAVLLGGCNQQMPQQIPVELEGYTQYWTTETPELRGDIWPVYRLDHNNQEYYYWGNHCKETATRLIDLAEGMRLQVVIGPSWDSEKGVFYESPDAESERIAFYIESGKGRGLRIRLKHTRRFRDLPKECKPI